MLLTEMSETASCTRDGNPTVRGDVDAFEALVNCHALEPAGCLSGERHA